MIDKYLKFEKYRREIEKNEQLIQTPLHVFISWHFVFFLTTFGMRENRSQHNFHCPIKLQPTKKKTRNAPVSRCMKEENL